MAWTGILAISCPCRRKGVAWHTKPYAYAVSAFYQTKDMFLNGFGEDVATVLIIDFDGINLNVAKFDGRLPQSIWV